jgi:hypothetical protein
MITLSTTLLIATLIFSLYLKIKKAKHAKLAYTNVSDHEDRQIIDSIKSLRKEIATESEITLKYKEFTGKDIDPEMLQKKLIEAEEAGIIRKKITKINDNPYVTWDINFL